MKAFNALIALAVLISIQACSAARPYVERSQTYYQSADYVNSAEAAAEGLRHDSGYPAAFEMLKQTFPLAKKELDESLEKAHRLKDDNENLLRVLSRYNAFLRNMKRLPPQVNSDTRETLTLDLSNADAIGSELTKVEAIVKEERRQAALKKANELYAKAAALAKRNDRDSKKAAAKLFKDAVSHGGNDFKDATARYEEMRKAATVRVAVGPIVRSVNDGAEIAEQISDKVVSSFVENQNNAEFVEIIPTSQLETLAGTGIANVDYSQLGASVDYFLSGKLSKSHFATNGPTPTQWQENRKKYITCCPNKEQIGYAKWRQFKGEAGVEVTVNYQLMEVSTKKLVKAFSVDGNAKREVMWYEIAPNSNDTAMPNGIRSQSTPQELPSKSTLGQKAVQSIVSQVVPRLSEFLN